jgi:hypothetical protein
MKIALFLILLIKSVPAFGDEIGFINLDLFGKSINEPVKILEKGTLISEKYRPIMVTLDQNASAYYAAQVYYDNSIGFDTLVTAFALKYEIQFADPTDNFTFGKSKKYGFACQISQDEDAFKVIYIWRDKIKKEEWKDISTKSLNKLGLECLVPALSE